MIARVKKLPAKRQSESWHAGFLAMLPQIERYAEIAFRKLDAAAREEAVQEVVCNACCAYRRLAERNKTDLAYASVLARFGIAQVRDGRKVGCSLNIQDVSSEYCHRRKGVVLERLDHFDRDVGEWEESVVEDQRTPVADQAAFRIDFPEWLATMNRRDQRIAHSLAVGTRTSEVAKRFHLSAGRISQKRREYANSWRDFHGECPEDLSTEPAREC